MYPLVHLMSPLQTHQKEPTTTLQSLAFYTPVTCFSLCSICDKELIKVQHSKEKCIIAGQHLNGFSPSAYHHVTAPSSRNRSGWKALNSSLRSSIQALEAPRPKIRRKCLHFWAYTWICLLLNQWPWNPSLFLWLPSLLCWCLWNASLPLYMVICSSLS